MKTKKFYLLALVSMVGFSPFASAAVDTVQANTGFFVPNDGLKLSSPYYRYFNQDWGWTHGAMAGGFTSANLNIAAFDIDAPAEVDNIYAKDDGVWTLLGSLAGGNNIWQFTNFSLGSNFFNDIVAGLEVKIDIDSTNTSQTWAVTLSKSVLTTDGTGPGNPHPTPDGGVSMLLLGSGLIGLASLRRFIR